MSKNNIRVLFALFVIILGLNIGTDTNHVYAESQTIEDVVKQTSETHNEIDNLREEAKEKLANHTEGELGSVINQLKSKNELTHTESAVLESAVEMKDEQQSGGFFHQAFLIIVFITLASMMPILVFYGF